MNENAMKFGPGNSASLQSPLAAKQKDIFADLIIEETRPLGQCAPDNALSVGVHALVIVALMIRPLFF